MSVNLNLCFESEHLAHLYTSMFFSTAVGLTLWFLNKTAVFYLVTPCDVNLQLLLMLVSVVFVAVVVMGNLLPKTHSACIKFVGYDKEVCTVAMFVIPYLRKVPQTPRSRSIDLQYFGSSVIAIRLKAKEHCCHVLCVLYRRNAVKRTAYFPVIYII